MSPGVENSQQESLYPPNSSAFSRGTTLLRVTKSRFLRHSDTESTAG